jgi:uncharacterized lipoprotein YajG
MNINTQRAGISEFRPTGVERQWIMRQLIALAGVSLLASCATPQSHPQPTKSTDTISWVTIAKQLNDNWNRCLEQSYRFTTTQTPDKNAAAEMAFQSCTSEEQDLASVPDVREIMPHLKAATKRVLIEEGHLP